VPRLLVLWDVDHTLINAGGVGLELYRIAFAELFGGEMPVPASMAGRTERAIVLEVLTLAGLPEPRGKVAAFHAIMAAHAPEVADLIREHGTALPGAAEALAALAMAGTGGANGDEHFAGLVVQALLTGNIRPLAEVKLGALGLTEHLDLDVGTYGDAHEVRAELVGPARRRAAQAYGADFSGEATVIVGDTPLDVEAALVTGARAVAVATGYFSVAELTAAGAHVVLPDLTDTGRVLAAVLPRPGS
jgi:phosphoglycolate phosphatase-like HAD superfamily hydrolase